VIIQLGVPTNSDLIKAICCIITVGISVITIYSMAIYLIDDYRYYLKRKDKENQKVKKIGGEDIGKQEKS